MCGIVTIFNYNSDERIDRSEMLKIREHMINRGPDGCGEWYSPDNRIGMGHRRLAIIDLSETGAQPICNEDGTIWITFNGEIYNYQALRSQLLAKDHRFKSNSDTEVIIHGYEEWGIEELLMRLRGMFAFALYDSGVRSEERGVRCQTSRSSDNSSPFTSHHSQLFIARDPFGIKPLYYADNGKSIRVASQVKALLAGGNINTSPEPAGHVGYFLWGHVPEPYTLYKGIRSLPAGSYICISASSQFNSPDTWDLKPKTYISIPQLFAEAEKHPLALSKAEVHERLREAMLDTVQHHLIADVSVGVFLSSGLDSSTLAALASETTTSRLNTITLGFKEYIGTDHNEIPLAEQVAKKYDTLQKTVLVGKKDFQADLDLLFDAMDQPTIDGINSYFVSKAAAQSGLKVAISGLGGDELFGGYPSFKQVPKMARLFGPLNKIPFLGRTFRAVSAPFLKYMTSPKYAGLLEYGNTFGGAYLLRRGMFMPWELPEVLDREMVKKGWQELNTMTHLTESLGEIRTEHLKVAALEMQWYMKNQLLRDTDWASMAHSLEVRVPLVDIQLLRALCSLLTTAIPPSKQDLAHTPFHPLPSGIITREKTGFTVPVREWMLGDDKFRGERGLRGWAKKVYAESQHNNYCGI